MVFSRVKELLTQSRLPPGTGELLSKVKDTGELMRGLDEMVTRNELAVSELNQELAALEELEAGEKEKIRSGGLGKRTRASILRRILRLRQQMDHIEDRLRIHDRNIRLHIDLIGTLKQIDAMAMAGVGEREVDEVILKFGEELKTYQSSLTSGEVLERIEKGDKLPGEEDLASLEKEIRNEAMRDTSSDGEQTVDPATEPRPKPRARTPRQAEAEAEEQ